MADRKNVRESATDENPILFAIEDAVRSSDDPLVEQLVQEYKKGQRVSQSQRKE
jgi:hypothetical protein